jgi:hypothetical protein
MISYQKYISQQNRLQIKNFILSILHDGNVSFSCRPRAEPQLDSTMTSRHGQASQAFVPLARRAQEWYRLRVPKGV